MPAPLPVPVYPPIAVQLRRRRWIRATVVTAIALAATTVLLDHLGCFGYRGDDWMQFDRGSVTITSVTDACTVTIRTTDTGREAIVHLLGTDAPPAALTAEAKAYTLTHLQGKTLTLRLNALQSRDAAGNLLAYLYLTDSDVFNIDLVHDGFAYADRRMNHLLRAPMDGAESDARKHRRGLWKDIREEDMPAWRQEWLRDLREHHHVVE